MFSKILFGRFVPTNSIIHRLDPRAKLMLSFYFIIIIFFANNWLSYTFLALFTLAIILCTRVKLSFFWDALSH